MKELSLKHEEYADTSQQDAHELLRNLLGGIEMEEVDLIKKLEAERAAIVKMDTANARKRATTIRGDTPTLVSWISERVNAESADDEGEEDSTSDESDSEIDSAGEEASRKQKKGAKSTMKPFIDTLFGGKLTSVIVCEFGHGKFSRTFLCMA